MVNDVVFCESGTGMSSGIRPARRLTESAHGRDVDS